jgi:hypothetical protein
MAGGPAIQRGLNARSVGIGNGGVDRGGDVVVDRGDRSGELGADSRKIGSVTVRLSPVV